jgi:hypothetical protein
MTPYFRGIIEFLIIQIAPNIRSLRSTSSPKTFITDPIDYQLLAYYKHEYDVTFKTRKRRPYNSIPKTFVYICCGAPHQYLYKNNGSKGSICAKSAMSVLIKQTSIIIY